MSLTETIETLATFSPGDAKRLLVDAIEASGSKRDAAKRLGISRDAFMRTWRRLVFVTPAPRRT